MSLENTIVGIQTKRQFTRIEELCASSASTVYKVEETTHGGTEIYALKMPYPPLDWNACEKLRQEKKIQSRFRHPHITRIVGSDRFMHDDDYHDPGLVPFFITPFAETTLEAEIEADRKPTLSQAITIFEQTADALVAVHKKNLVYGDNKPGNVLLRNNANGGINAELTDFDIARPPHPEEDEDEIIFGTLLYYPPEAVRGICTPRSDQFGWAAGIVYPTITGQPPYDPDPESPYHPYIYLEHDYLYQTPLQFVELIGEKNMTPQHRALQEVANRALKEDPLERYESMAVLLDDLRLRIATAEDK